VGTGAELIEAPPFDREALRVRNSPTFCPMLPTRVAC
jgi:hypothetical protein